MKKLLLIALLVAGATFAEDKKDAPKKGDLLIPIPATQMQQMSILQLQAQLLKAEKDKLDLQYELLTRDIFEVAGVTRDEYALELGKSRLQRRGKKDEKPNEEDKKK